VVFWTSFWGRTCFSGLFCFLRYWSNRRFSTFEMRILFSSTIGFGWSFLFRAWIRVLKPVCCGR
jgi:hypothetical protein